MEDLELACVRDGDKCWSNGILGLKAGRHVRQSEGQAVEPVPS